MTITPRHAAALAVAACLYTVSHAARVSATEESKDLLAAVQQARMAKLSPALKELADKCAAFDFEYSAGGSRWYGEGSAGRILNTAPLMRSNSFSCSLDGDNKVKWLASAVGLSPEAATEVLSEHPGGVSVQGFCGDMCGSFAAVYAGKSLVAIQDEIATKLQQQYQDEWRKASQAQQQEAVASRLPSVSFTFSERDGQYYSQLSDARGGALRYEGPAIALANFLADRCPIFYTKQGLSAVEAQEECSD